MGNKGEQTRQTILETASVLFSERGYSAVSMQDICTACGLSKGGLYRHFDSKQNLFLALLETAQAQETQRETEMMRAGLPAQDILSAFLADALADLERRPNLNMAIYEFCTEHRSHIGRTFLETQYARGRAALLGLLQYGAARNELSPTDAEAAVDTALLLLEGMKLVNEVMPLSGAVSARVLRQLGRTLGLSEGNDEK